VLAVGHALNAMAGGFVYPFFADYLRGNAASGALLVGAVFAAATLLSAAGRIVGGELADRRGRRFVVLAAVAGRSAAVAALGLAVYGHAPMALVALPFLLASVARGAFEPAADAMVADLVAPAQRPRAYAWMRIGRNAGWALGPALGGFLGAPRFALLAGLAALLGFANLLLSLTRLPETPHRAAAARFHPRDLKVALADPAFRRHCALTFALFVLFAQLLVAVSLEAAPRLRLSSHEIGWTYTLNGVMVVVLQAAVTRAAVGAPRRVLALGSLLYGAGYLTIGAAPVVTIAWLGVALITLGEMLSLPLSAAVAADIAPADQRGRYLGAFGVFVDVGHGLGQVVGGAGLVLAGAQTLAFWAAVSVFAVLLAFGYARFGAGAARVDAGGGAALQ
jgi:MFS family permease